MPPAGRAEWDGGARGFSGWRPSRRQRSAIARGARADQQAALAEYAGNDFHLNLHICRWASGVIVWLAGDAASAAKDLQRTGAELSGMGAGPLGALVSTDWAEAAADAGDAAAAQDAARNLGSCPG